MSTASPMIRTSKTLLDVGYFNHPATSLQADVSDDVPPTPPPKKSKLKRDTHDKKDPETPPMIPAKTSKLGDSSNNTVRTRSSSPKIPINNSIRGSKKLPKKENADAKLKIPKGPSGSTPTRLPRGKGLRRRLSESARDIPGEGFSRLTRFGSGLRRKISNSTKDLFTGLSNGNPTSENIEIPEPMPKSGLRRNLSASMKDLFSSSFGLNSKGNETVLENGIGRKLSRRLSFLTSAMKREKINDPDDIFNTNQIPRLRKARSFDVTVVLPDGTRRIVSTK